ncbi:nitroreductase [Rhodobacter sp. KR11]|uniref:nitroreductase family protein n=1 Tax=Rhodobacter sp. KR11 TaxID=2974588 RepID=UPI002222891D|nr:nitroreductase [Rhodobacter sp. KR11]
MPTTAPMTAFDFLARRRSHSAKFFDPAGAVPDRAALEPILQAALRVPDHGKLEPWRLVVLQGASLRALGDIATDLAPDAEAAAKGAAIYQTARLAVAVISAPKDFPKVPEVEQRASAHALCLNLVNAAEAAGWGACWLTGWPAHHPDWAARALGCTGAEQVAGIIHIGTAGPEAPDRPRPDLAKIVEWRA